MSLKVGSSPAGRHRTPTWSSYANDQGAPAALLTAVAALREPRTTMGGVNLARDDVRGLSSPNSIGSPRCSEHGRTDGRHPRRPHALHEAGDRRLLLHSVNRVLATMHRHVGLAGDSGRML